MFLAGSCAAPPAPAPAPPAPLPTPVPAPAPRPTPAPAPAPPAEWRDAALTPGTWAYRQDARGSIALFGRAGEAAELTLRCDRQRARIYLSRRLDAATAEGVPLTVRTTSQLRALTALPVGGDQAYVAIELAVRDPLIDAIGFSRGRFAVEGAGMPVLVIPSWAEILRVAEDCRS